MINSLNFWKFLLFLLQWNLAQNLELSLEYFVDWEYEPINKSISFQVSVATRGYVGFGISPTGGMTGADIVIGGIDDDGHPYFGDYHAIGAQTPILDQSQDWILNSATENGTHTFLNFTRPLETCDAQDLAITMDTQKLIWSYGPTDNIQYHGVNRGTKLRNILDPPITPPDLSKYKVWNMFNRVKVPSHHTTYWCSIHQTPNFTGAHHMIGFDAYLPDATAKRHTHHVDVYACKVPSPEVAAIFEKYIGHEGRDCYSPDPNIPDFPANYCDTIELGWVIGGEITLFPEHAGFPFEPNTFYMLEVHYDNPDYLEGLEYETGHQIYYTDQLREQDAGYLLVGSMVSYTHMIPPNSVNFTQVAHCSPWCTENFPEDGLNVFAFLFHAHTSARGMKVRLFRDGVELPWILYDAHFDFNYQQNRMLREEFKLMPGDHLTVECLYDTTWKSGGATIGGRSTSEEMCMAYFFYYPNLPEIVHCNSQLPQPSFLRMLGVENVTLEGEWQEDPTVTAPEHLRGLPLTRVIEEMDWNEETRFWYQVNHRYSPHEVECYPIKGRDWQITPGYPNVPEWQPVDSCAA